MRIGHLFLTQLHTLGIVMLGVRISDGQTFVTGVEVGLSVSLQVAGDVGRAEHLPTDATGHLAFVSDHVGTESVFGGKSRGTGLQTGSKVSGVQQH